MESSDEESSDAGSVTRCICGEAHNVGLMVQCDKCEVWQHCECIGLIQDKLPDHYYCDQCRPENHQVIKKSNGRSKRLYHAGLVNQQDSSPNNSESPGRTSKRRKKDPSIAHTEVCSPKSPASSLLSPPSSDHHTPLSPSSSPLIQEDEPRIRRTKTADPTDESPLRKKYTPYWNYSDGRPAREGSPPAKVKYPSSKMSFSDMHKRAKQILDCITKLKSEEPLLNQKRVTDPYYYRPRSLSVSSSHSSLSTASTLPLLDECDTIPSTDHEEIETNTLHTGNSSSSSSSGSESSLSEDSSPLTPLPFMAAQIKGQESPIDILERMDQEILKFQRKFGILYQ
ncbi:hypothetical protein EDC96DRAFT_577177 [Choanephora cucurbitarum]|nr:hypothetical protein EDC96DRAFT_577177 [Choanephora cucurbitarum]